MKTKRRIALVHDWLTGMRGGEKVLEVLCELFPTADLLTLVHVKGNMSPTIESRHIITSPLQRLPHIGSYYRHLLPFMPWAMGQLDFSGYDLIISTSHCVAKAATPSSGARHVCYCHTPMRYIWDQYDSYFGPGRASWPVRAVMKCIRPALQSWDLKTLPRVHHFLANSNNVQERIGRLYQRSSVVLYPPADIDFYGAPRQDPNPWAKEREDFYLIVSALAPYKRVDVAIEAFQKMGKRLVIIGEGQESQTLRSTAGPMIEFRGWQSNEELRSHYQRCRALIFPGEEDFGIVPVEAMAAGCPVIALGRGGALETVIDGKTGLFFPDATAESLQGAIRRFESLFFDPKEIKVQAQNFSRQRCKKAFRAFFIEYRDEMS